MHCELIVPGLFAEASGARTPSLELLLARGRCASGESHSTERWLEQGFGLKEESFPAGALTLAAAGREAGAYCWAPGHWLIRHDGSSYDAGESQ